LAYVYVANPIAMYELTRSWKGDTGKYIYRKTLQTTGIAISMAPGPGKFPQNRTGINYSTGRLQSLIRPQRGRHNKELEGRVVAIPEHSLYVHGGTNPHAIVPKTAPRLTFFWHKKGRVVAFHKVQHPGQKAQPFLSDALEEAM
jgi:hypothetical protein